MVTINRLAPIQNWQTKAWPEFITMTDSAEIDRSDSDFLSEGTKCAGWLFCPQGIEKPPVVILAHGFAGERAFGLVDFAREFLGNGYATFVFDYRTFGDSDGSPRNLVDPTHHGADWDAAIAHVRNIDQVDHDRIILWGTSFSGAHVICAAARDQKVTATISQVPFSGIPKGPDIPKAKVSFGLMVHILWDLVKTAVTGSPHYVPVVGPPGSTALLNTPECEPGYRALIPEGTTFDNRVPAKSMLKIGGSDPISAAEKIVCPALVIAAEQDSLVPIEQAKYMASKLKNGELHTLACNHFAPYREEWFKENVKIQIDFLKRVL
ncbi:MAG: alpha/beta hydrolase [Gammaproteobacteria bacterium]|nr:alpha/beta hydrolase [Gammaproteobacteria bacterium]